MFALLVQKENQVLLELLHAQLIVEMERELPPKNVMMLMLVEVVMLHDK